MDVQPGELLSYLQRLLSPSLSSIDRQRMEHFMYGVSLRSYCVCMAHFVGRRGAMGAEAMGAEALLLMSAMKAVVERRWESTREEERARAREVVANLAVFNALAASLLAHMVVQDLVVLGDVSSFRALVNGPQALQMTLLYVMQLVRRQQRASLLVGEISLLLHNVQPTQPTALRVLRHALEIRESASNQQSSLPSWMVERPLELPHTCSATMRVWAALRVMPPAHALLYWMTGVSPPRLSLVTKVVERCSGIRVPPREVVKASMEMLLLTVPLLSVGAADHPAAKLWSACLDAAVTDCVSCIHEALADPATVPVALQALQCGAWQLWDHFDISTTLGKLPWTGALVPRLLLCVAAWVTQLKPAPRRNAYQVALHGLRTQNRIVRHAALRLMVALVEDVEHRREPWLSPADHAVIMEACHVLLFEKAPQEETEDQHGDTLWDKRLHTLQLLGQLLMDGAIVHISVFQTLGRVWSEGLHSNLLLGRLSFNCWLLWWSIFTRSRVWTM